MAKQRVPKPCLEHRCTEYALPGKSRCAAHHREALAEGKVSPGTTAQWSRARKLALERARYVCERCGKTDAESRAEGKGGLHVHHVDGRGVRAREHDQALLEVRCVDCHRKTFGRPTSWREEQERKAQIVKRARRRSPRSGPPRSP